MKNPYDMTPQELRDLANEKEKESKGPIKEGFLKESLYCFTGGIPIGKTFYSASERDACIEKYKSCWELAIKTGSRFVCYSEDGEESWFDGVNYGVEYYSHEWAEQHLENIRNLNAQN